MCIQIPARENHSFTKFLCCIKCFNTKLIETPAFKSPNNWAALQSDASSAEEDLIPPRGWFSTKPLDAARWKIVSILLCHTFAACSALCAREERAKAKAKRERDAVSLLRPHFHARRPFNASLYFVGFVMCVVSEWATAAKVRRVVCQIKFSVYTLRAPTETLSLCACSFLWPVQRGDSLAHLVLIKRRLGRRFVVTKREHFRAATRISCWFCYFHSNSVCY